MQFAKTSVAQVFSVILTIVDREFFDGFRGVAGLMRAVVARVVTRAPPWARQHFLKRDTVFFNVLVYSEWSAFRFPSARSN
jgi:hypothetical protein